MNRKSNPWVALVALILLLVLIVCCSGCESSTDAAKTDTPRFIVETASVGSPSVYHDVHIITDTETGVQYIFFRSTNAGGLTVLEPAPEEGAKP